MDPVGDLRDEGSKMRIYGRLLRRRDWVAGMCAAWVQIGPMRDSRLVQVCASRKTASRNDAVELSETRVKV